MIEKNEEEEGKKENARPRLYILPFIMINIFVTFKNASKNKQKKH